ncbi:sirohydrochlorin chelatase [Planococcus sp. CPCC 101016]|uniref:sirohydrochlorin chelatase n=1 Tax=Planococcus sp. CPCC 101016 TaxID=2599617 RepID=UPI0011B436C0|nr:sirohydrochlorin chelatase [Planococcus sp. CPCC 101016]TWT06378.1 sirohydrochlorin chelatase [Planococcus sp. CPCC 101016]
MKAILYVGHGTRSKKGAAEATGFLEKIIGQNPISIQEISFLELTEPFIEEGFTRCVEKGATKITVVPLFLLAAGHIKTDIPEALLPLQRQYPQIQVTVADPFGVQKRILDAIAEMVRAGRVWSGTEALLVVGRGSSDPAIHKAFGEIAEGLKQRLGTETISLCYLAATTPTFQQGIKDISREIESRVIVIPYLLFEGLLLDEIEREVDKRKGQGQQISHTGCLSRHQAIQEIILERSAEDQEETGESGRVSIP